MENNKLDASKRELSPYFINITIKIIYHFYELNNEENKLHRLGRSLSVDPKVNY